MKPTHQGFSLVKKLAAFITLIALLLAPLVLLDLENPQEAFPTPAATAGSTTSRILNTPVSLIPSVRIEAGAQLEIPNHKLAKTSGKKNTDFITLTGAKLTLDQSPGKWRSEGTKTLSEAISAQDDDGQPIPDTSGIKIFDVHRLTIQVRRPGGSVHYLGRFDGQIHLKDDGLRFSGTVARKNRASTIVATLAMDPNTDGIRPIDVEVSGDILNFKMKGFLETAEKLSLRADKAALTTENMSRLLSWLGMGQGSNGIAKFQSTTSFDWTNATIALDGGTFSIDGNEAQGRVSFNLDPTQPSIDATLAFASLDLSQYVTAATASPSLSKELMLRAWRALHNSIFSETTSDKFENIDADLRLSAQSVELFDRPVGSGAAIVLLKDGQLQADFADITLADGGHGNAQFEADVTGYLPRFDVRGKFEAIDLGQLSNSWFKTTVLDGTGKLSLDLEAEGNTWDQILNTLSGDAGLRAQRGATIGLDLASMFGQSKALPSDGWGPFANGTSSVDALTLSLKAARGSVTTKVVRAKRGETLMAAKGSMRLSDLLLDLVLTRVAVGKGEDESVPTRTPAPGMEALELRGPLLKPVIRSIASSRSG
jgi:AsmA-like C-terminal region